MRKQHFFEKEFEQATKNSNFILYRNIERSGMNIKILIKDSTITDENRGTFDPSEIDASTQVYGCFISSMENENQALLNKLGGICKMNNYLNDPKHWRIIEDGGSYRLSIIGERNNKTIQSFNLEEISFFNLFEISDVMKILAEGANVTVHEHLYLMSKYAELNEKEKRGIKIFTREQVKENMRIRVEEKKRKEYEATPEYQERLRRENYEKQQQQIREEGVLKQQREKEQMIIQAFPYFQHSPSTFKTLRFDTKNYTIRKEEMNDHEVGVMMNQIRQQFSVKLVKLQKSKNYSIMIGFCDKEYIHSYSIQNMEKPDYKKTLEKRPKLVAFCNNGKVKADSKFNWKDAVDGDKKFDYILKEGDTVTVKYEGDKGLITWYVTNSNFQLKKVANYLKSLNDGTIWVPYVELEKIGDMIQWYEK